MRMKRNFRQIGDKGGLATEVEEVFKHLYSRNDALLVEVPFGRAYFVA